jgi:hypothetical protein
LFETLKPIIHYKISWLPTKSREVAREFGGIFRMGGRSMPRDLKNQSVPSASVVAVEQGGGQGKGLHDGSAETGKGCMAVVRPSTRYRLNM